ncbi:MAG: hypothetical protein K2Q12_00050 [Rickettsiales bacterium]|nr:hypothetical protein [Rickettsiales bacterium]
MSGIRSTSLALLLVLSLQTLFWWSVRNRLPDMTVVPDVPGRQALQVMSFGDEEFLFRAMAMSLTNAGDTFGRFTALYKYDLHKIYLWFTLLDQFNSRSNVLPSMAAYYFSQTQKTSDVRYMVDYLYEHAKPNIQQKWWWMAQGVYLAMHKLKDTELALKLASTLTEAKDVPLWVNQLPAFVYEKRGEFDAALGIMENILQHTQDIEPGELRYMKYFIDERISKLDALDTDERQRLDDAKLPDQDTSPPPSDSTP